MIIRTPDDVTAAVLAELLRAENPRFREIMGAAVRHLHGFIRDARLTEAEFHQACALIVQLGQLSNASHNEVVLVAGSLGLSSLVCLLNNGEAGNTETTANLMGPFWRIDSPRVQAGGSIVRSPTAGAPIFVNAWVRDAQGRAIEGAEVDVWHACTEGFYESQDPAQADMNLRGRLTTDAAGRISFRSIEPVGYPIPLSGPVGALLRAQGRHAAGAHPLHDPQAGLQGAVLAGLFQRRPAPRQRCAVRRNARLDRPVRAACRRARARRRCAGPLVFAGPPLRH